MFREFTDKKKSLLTSCIGLVRTISSGPNVNDVQVYLK